MTLTRFHLRDDLQDSLAQAAAELRRPQDWIINEALAAYFEREDRRRKKERETLDGLADVEAGRLIDGEEVLAWIASWGTSEELPRPGR